VRKENRESGKRERGVNDDSSFRLNVSENAVSTHTVPIILEHGTPTISADIEGMSRGLILDTGSNISIMQPGISKSNVQVTTMEPYGVTGDTLDIKGQQTVTFRMNGRRFTHPFLVCSLPTTAAGLLGTDFLSRLGAKLDFDRSKMSISDINNAPRGCNAPQIGHVALTAFSEESQNTEPKQRGTERVNEQLLASPHPEATIPQDQTWLVRAVENVTIQPRCRQIIRGRLDADGKQSLPPLVCVEPARVPIEGILPARGLTRVEIRANSCPEQPTREDRDVARTRKNCALIMVANFSDEELTIPKATVLGIAEEVTEETVDKINVRDNSQPQPLSNREKENKNKTLYKKLLEGKLDHLSEDDKRTLEPVLLRYAHVFHDEQTNDFKGTTVIEHQIIVDNARPIRKPQYRVPYSLREEMKTQVENMLQKGVIRESNSPWAAPALLVPKRSTDGKPKFRFCVDFRALNSVTKFDTYPLPVFDEATSTLHGSKYYSVLDCYSGFWQINIKEEHKEKTGFSVPSGHYEFNRLPFGLSNSPSSFQRLMDIVLKNLVGTECFVSLMTSSFFQNQRKNML